jgi:predicted ribosome quality control (RQC) complex YloA/Tae2 family protein
MTWDSPLTAAAARELGTLLEGARLRAHRFGWEERELALFFRSGTLRWSLHPQEGWLAFLPPVAPPEEARPLSARVVRVEATSDERTLRIHLQKPRGLVREVQVVIELMTGQWNALLLEGENETVRHLLWTRRSEARTLTVGHRYRAPEPSSRAGVTDPLSSREWRSLMEPFRGEGDKKALLERLAFSSPVNLAALLDEGDGAASASSRPLEEGVDAAAASSRPLAGFQLWERLRSQDPAQPCILDTTRGQQPYPVILQGFPYTEFPSVLEAIGTLAGGATRGISFDDRVLERLERALHQARGRAKGLQREMARSADPEEWRNKANLLLARLAEVPRGAAQVQLTGFEGEPVVIPLDPSRTPQENADVLYQEASRLERARERIPLLLEGVKEKAEGLERLREELIQGTVTPQEAEARMPGDGKPGKVPGKPEASRLPYLRFRSSGGLEIRVGRGSADNDALTFRHSRPDDIWLHARDVAGAHVILRWTEPEGPPAKDLAEAAILAAVHSRARSSGVIPVDWTRRKHVRRARKAPPGTVVPRQTRTIFVEPDPQLPKRLRFED